MAIDHGLLRNTTMDFLNGQKKHLKIFKKNSGRMEQIKAIQWPSIPSTNRMTHSWNGTGTGPEIDGRSINNQRSQKREREREREIGGNTKENKNKNKSPRRSSKSSTAITAIGRCIFNGETG